MKRNSQQPSDRSLAMRLTFALSAVIVTVTGVVIWLSYASELQNAKLLAKSKLEKTQVYLEGSLSDPLWNLNFPGVHAIVDAAMHDETTASIKVLSEKDELIYERNKNGKTNRLLRKNFDIYYRNNLVASVKLAVAVKPFEDAAYEKLEAALMTLGLGVIVIILLTGYFVRHYLKQSFQDIDSVLKRFSSGDYTRPCHSTRYNEFQPVHDGISNLGEKIQEQIRQLKAYQTNLELLVDERTVALAQVNDELQRQQIFLQAVLENITDGIVACDENGILSLVNRATRVFHGIEQQALHPDEWAGHYDLFKADGKTAMEKKDIPLFRAFEGQEVKDVEMVIASREGKKRTLLASGRALISDTGKKLGAVVSMHDITESKRAQQAMLQAKKDAEAANLAKGIFLANMSHELRSPLNTVLGFSQIMKNDPVVTEAQKEYLDIINRSGAQLMNLIDDVLVMSKIESGQIRVKAEGVDLTRMLYGIGSMMRTRAVEKGLLFSLEQAFDNPRYVQTDAGKMRQVLINLTRNAIKYTEKGRVTLRVSIAVEPSGVDQWTLQFEVEDTGIGIEKDNLDRIFHPFVQVGELTGIKGTGLGLSISRQYVELMGGEISVESEPGRGSIFRVIVPVKEAKPEEVITTAVSRRVTGLEDGQPACRILVVDDQEESRLLLKKLLEPVGIEVREAANGQEAIDVFQTWQPDFIWMDIRMPVMDGMEATRRVRALEQQTTRTPIVALTAHAFEEEREHFLAAGCDGFVRKPFRQHTIFETMAKYLGVRFVYEEPEPADQTAEPELTPQMLARLPNDLLLNLKQAVIELDTEKTLVLIARITEMDANLGVALQSVVKNLGYTRLLAMLEALDIDDRKLNI